jgi:hypothetical protein
MTSLASNLNEGGSLAIDVAAIAVGGIAGYVVGRIFRAALEDSLSWANDLGDSMKEALDPSNWIDIDLSNPDGSTPGWANLNIVGDIL